MGKHLLLLLLCLSLMPGFLQALTCFQCDNFDDNGICHIGQTTCETKDGHKCYWMTVIKDGMIRYGYQGCIDECFKTTFLNPDVRVEYSCCDRSYCNWR